MVQDHSKADEELKQIASKDGVQLPSKLDKSAEQNVNKLEKLSGGKFDAEYMKQQVSDHKKVIKSFEEEAKSGKSADMKRFAEEMLPVLREHLKLAESAETAAASEALGKTKTSGIAAPGLEASQQATGATRLQTDL